MISWHSCFYRREQLRRRALPVAVALLCSLGWAASAPASAAPAAAQGAAGGCAASDGLQAICGPVASEDLVRVPHSRWLIASGMNVGMPAHLYLIDSRAKQAGAAFPSDDTPPPTAPFHSNMGCSGPPDLARLSLDGLALRAGKDGRHTLYATNHGDRMAVEVFAVDARGPRPVVHWVDCAPMPGKTLPNAVATLPHGGLLVISFYDPTDPQSWARMARGEMTGRIFEWHPVLGFSPLAQGATSGGNGLETSADGSTVYASSWSGHRLVVLSLREGSRREIPLDFMPDNLHRLPDGSLLVGGQRTTVAAIEGCKGPQCPQPWVIARVNPADGTVKTLLERPGSPEVNYACGAIEVDGTLFVTVRGDRRILYATLK